MKSDVGSGFLKDLFGVTCDLMIKCRGDFLNSKIIVLIICCLEKEKERNRRDRAEQAADLWNCSVFYL